MIHHIKNSIQIARPINEVFDCITTPDNWPKWHPRVIGVMGATDHSLKVGEQVSEEFIDVGKHNCVLWTVIEYEETKRWVVDGIDDIEGNDVGQVAFTFGKSSNGTLLERENTYFTNFFYGIYNWLIIWPRKNSEAAEALQRLKIYLER